MFHGKKRYFQVLLDPARAELLDELAEQRGMRPAALVREIVYLHLERTFAPTVYNHARTNDMNG
jgi:hypothetical protein